MLRIRVSDNGKGMETEKISHVFERFFRGDEVRNSKCEGSGLGLSIAQNLTTLQKGTFEIYLDGDLFKVQIGFSCLDVPQPEIEIQMR